jgi:hypothetical protein
MQLAFDQSHPAIFVFFCKPFIHVYNTERPGALENVAQRIHSRADIAMIDILRFDVSE